MRRQLPILVALGALAVGLGLAVWWSTRGPTAPSPDVTPAPGVAPGAAPDAVPSVDPIAARSRTKRFGPDDDHAKAPTGPGPEVSADLHREFDTPDAAEHFLEDQVFELLLALEPTLDPSTFGRDCTDDGRHCTFQGPWIGDDLMKRWVRAISDGTASTEALEGVRFSGLRPEERGGEKVLVLEAHAP